VYPVNISIQDIPIAVKMSVAGDAGSRSHKRHCSHKHSRSNRERKDAVKRLSPGTLLDIASKFVAKTVPFQRIEERFPRIPEPVQERLVFWAFPRDERDIRMYSSPCGSTANALEYQNSPFCQGMRLLDQGAVTNVLQVGFHLSGEVIPGRVSQSQAYTSTEQEIKYKVSVSFDRCKITSVTCSCNSRDIFWCQHVVALAVYRIRNTDKVPVRVPISETLLQMNREQLQKFVQYLISSHHTEVLPTAQRLSDEILKKSSAINQIAGAPDPTAGQDAEEENSWHLDEGQVQDQVKAYLEQGGYYSASKHLTQMFAKVREMLRAQDSNGSRMLALMTEQFLVDPRLLLWRSQGTPMTDKCRQLWDQLGALWVCVVLNPAAGHPERTSWRQLLTSWTKNDVCPLEDPDYKPSTRRRQTSGSSDEESSTPEPTSPPSCSSRPPILGPDPTQQQQSTRRKPRTVFHKALDALQMTWNDPQLKRLLRGKSYDCQEVKGKESEKRIVEEPDSLLWHEHIPTACARVDALRSHGYTSEALRLAVAIVRTMKRNQQLALSHWRKQCHKILKNCTKSGVARRPGYASWEGWIGHPMDPIGALFDTLTEASLVPEDRGRMGFHLDEPVQEEGIVPPPPLRFRHIRVSGSRDRDETYLSLAAEAGLLGLGQQSIMPAGLYSQEKVIRQEEKLITRLGELQLDTSLLAVLCRQAGLLLEMGPSSSMGCGIHPESSPVHAFAKYIFLAILPHDADLAFRVGRKALRLPILDDNKDPEDKSGNAAALVLSRFPRWFTLGHIENQQSSLASTLIIAAKDNIVQLTAILEAAQRHVHSSSHLFKLAQDAFRYAVPTEGPRHPALLNVAFQLGLQVMRLTKASMNWRRREMVRWLVTCATEVGLEALLSIMSMWNQLFTATEATGPVATSVMSHSTVMRLGLDYRKQEELSNCARTLALQCAHEDPPNCALNALTLCESDPIAFETAYQIVTDAAANGMTSSQLFTIARYMEHRGYPHRAHKLALLAMKNVHLSYNQDTHPAINDIHWACALSHSLGKSELSSMLPLVVQNVQCATVLSDILRRCSMTAPGVPSHEQKSRSSSKSSSRPLSYDRSPLRQLLESALAAFVTTTHSRLTSISPRHYAEFIDFLTKARETFLLAADGHIQFAQLIENIKSAYKGKKKLITLVKERFG